MDQNGHGDYRALFWIFIVALVTVVAVEGVFVTFVAIFWDNLFLRILFSILALSWIAVIILYVWDSL
jgi:hypothetical protein